MAKVLIIGSGGREHALAWKLAQSPKVNKVYVAPGNGGTTDIAENVDIGFTDIDALLDFAKAKEIDLTVIGQEAASEAGAADAFKKAGLLIFGPTKAAAEIESSKAFSKDLMHLQKIPTAAYKTFSGAKKALEYIKESKFPAVIKADGLATGKGVIIAQNLSEAEEAIDNIMIKKIFGISGDRVVVEEFLKGREVSAHALCDGKSAVLFPASQDHKQAFDGDRGPNTGGMGVFTPVPWVSKEHIKTIENKVVQPALDGLRRQGRDFSGCLYPGLMIDGQSVKVVEFNSRFGDPEAEVYMRLLDSDLYEILLACACCSLSSVDVRWKKGFAVCVALASKGYPGDYQKGDLIYGIEDAVEKEGIVVFHAGTKKDNTGLKTAGGRVLYVTALGQTLDEAIKRAYDAVKLIHFEGMHYRTDIGRRDYP